MPKDPVDGEGFAADVVGAAAYAAPRPQRKDFQPWHRPRKQFIRHYQWCEQIDLLLGDMEPEGRVLRYLGLPGVDLLDLRHFHRTVCEPKQLGLRFLGFNSGANPASESQVELNISLDEVRRLSAIDPKSNVICDDFCHIANDNSIAWREAKNLGPFDIVNLDLCDGFCTHPPGVLDDTHYNAITRLLALQARKKTPWLLLLSTRAGSGHMHDGVFQKLLAKYVQNLSSCPPFKAQSTAALSISDEESLRRVSGTSDGLLPVFLIGLCKWLVSLAVGQSPPSKVEVRSIIGYRVETGCGQEDLVSLALRFEPTFVSARDEMGLAGRAVEAAPDECDLSVKALKRVGNRKNADTILANDAGLYEQMIVATTSLLELARYDLRAYREWLRES